MGTGGVFGGATEPGSARQEAERLVATVLAMAQTAASTLRAGTGPADGATNGTADGVGFATGTPECCVCPICRTITALRDPRPDVVERLATGAGDFAAGVASLLRALSGVAGPAPAGSPAGGTSGHRAGDGTAGRYPADQAGGARPDQADPDATGGVPDGTGERHVDPMWRETTGTGHDSWPAAETDVWAAATRAEPGPAVSADPADPGGPSSDVPEPDRPSSRERADRAGSGGSPTGSGGRRAAVPASRTPENGVTGPADQMTSDGL